MASDGLTIVFQPSVSQGHGMQFEAWLTLSNPSEGHIAFKVKLNKSKRYLVKPYQGIISPSGTAVVRILVRDDQFALLMAKLARAGLDSALAVDGSVAWDLEDMFQVQRMVLPESLAGTLGEGDVAGLSSDLAAELTAQWGRATKADIESSVLSCRYLVPVSLITRLSADPKAELTPQDFGPALAQAAPSQTGARAAPAPAPAPPAAADSAKMEEMSSKLETLHAQYSDLLRTQMAAADAEARARAALEERNASIAALTRRLADAEQAVVAAQDAARAAQIDGAEGGSPVPDSTLRKRGGSEGGDVGGDVAAGAPLPPAAAGGFPLWQLVLAVVMAFLLGRLAA